MNIHRVAVGILIVAQRDASDPSATPLHHPDAGVSLSRKRAGCDGEHVNRRTRRIYLLMVKLVMNHELCRNAFHDRMFRMRDGHFKVTKLVVRSRAASDE